MSSRVVLAVVIVAGLTAYVTSVRQLRHKELIARTIAYGATRRALERSALFERSAGASTACGSIPH
jgi:hypothetical protein